MDDPRRNATFREKHCGLGVPLCCNYYRTGRCKRCSRCKIVYYCNVECQKRHYKAHRKLCWKVGKAQAEVTRLEEEMKNAEWNDGGHVNYFEEYCRARLKLALAVKDMGYTHELMYVNMDAIDRMLDLMRLSAKDELLVRDIVPFVMIDMWLGEATYKLIWLWWTGNWKRQVFDYEKWTRDVNHKDWLGDLLKIPETKDSVRSFAHYVALLLMKLYILWHHDMGELDCYTESQMEEQWRQVGTLLTIVHKKNPHMLKSLVDPQPLKAKTLRSVPEEEAYTILLECERPFDLAPLAGRVVEAFLTSDSSNNEGFTVRLPQYSFWPFRITHEVKMVYTNST